jgi:DNA-binding MarR family transcriptional regulator
MTESAPTPQAGPLFKPGGKAPYELVCSTAFLLKRLGLLAKERTMDAFEARGASPYHYAVLAVLEEGARDTQSQIADALGYDRSWLVGLLDELEEGGFIERKRCPDDRRRHLVSLTPAGKQRLAELRATAKSVENELLGSLEPEQRTRLHELLLQVAAEHDPRYAPNGEQPVAEQTSD